MDNYKLSKKYALQFRRFIFHKSPSKLIANILEPQTREKYKKYIEFQFSPEMTWDNYGEWELDHIVPLFFFDMKNPDEIKLCWSMQNLMPKLKRINKRKGACLLDSIKEINRRNVYDCPIYRQLMDVVVKNTHEELSGDLFYQNLYKIYKE